MDFILLCYTSHSSRHDLDTQKNDTPKYGHFDQVNHLISPQKLNSPLRIYVQFIIFMTVGERMPTKKTPAGKTKMR